ncbi:MAG: phage virion morphogenesis protein [Candidatus Gastranaerophilales bacterium]|nr:phage virion morphogenesis protein [Candidatus Gastranaerophilales bacterium]
MGTSIEVSINDKEILDYLYKYAMQVKNMKPMLRKIAHIIKTDIDDNFKTEGKNNSQSWQEWSLPWAKIRKKKGRGEGKIMQFNGELRTSFTRKVTDTDAIVGTNKKYAAIHNFGGPVKTRNGGKFEMPKREYASWSDSLKTKVLAEIVYELKKLDYKEFID